MPTLLEEYKAIVEEEARRLWAKMTDEEKEKFLRLVEKENYEQSE